MSKLPSISHPITTITLSTGEKFSFTPFLVRDEKLLLQALESDDIDSILQATKQVVKNCCVSGNDVDNLSLYDLEYVYLNLRAQSIGEVVNQSFVCKNETVIDSNTEPQVCNGPLSFDIELTKIPIATAPERKVQLTDTVGVQLRYPTADITHRSIKEEDEEKAARDIIIDCIEAIYDADQVYHAKEFSRADLEGWLDGLSQAQNDKIATWFEKLPTISYETDITCGKCGFNHHIRLEGISDFFE